MVSGHLGMGIDFATTAPLRGVWWHPIGPHDQGWMMNSYVPEPTRHTRFWPFMTPSVGLPSRVALDASPVGRKTRAATLGGIVTLRRRSPLTCSQPQVIVPRMEW